MSPKPSVLTPTALTRAAGAWLLLGGAGLVVLAAVVIDRLGLSQPGLGPHERMAVQIGLAAIASGILLRGLPHELAVVAGTELQEAWQRVRHRYAPDSRAVAGLCLAALLLGTWYVALGKPAVLTPVDRVTVPGTEWHPFYDPTIPDPARLPFLYHGVAFALTAGAFYGLCRLGMGRWMALCCGLGLLTSSFHLAHLVPALYRVYGKAPFVLATVLLMGVGVRWPMHRTWSPVAAAAGGLVAGLGLTMREDLLILALLFPVTILACWQPAARRPWRLRLLSLAAFAAAFLFAAGPVLREPSRPGWVGPAVAGLATPLDAGLGLTRPPYDWGHLFLDEMARGLPFAHARAVAPEGAYAYSWSDYTAVSAGYLAAVVRQFPADMLARAYAAVMTVLDLPFQYVEPPMGVSAWAVRQAYHLREALVSPFAGFGWLIAAAAIVLLTARSVRAGLFTVALLAVLGGYPAIQFCGKHYFHLEFLGWWLLGFVLSRVARGAAWARQHRADWRSEAARRAPAMARGLAALILLPGLLVAPLAAARAYQAPRVAALLQRYADATRAPIAVSAEALGNGSVLLTSDTLVPRRPRDGIAGEFFIAEFGGPACPVDRIWPTFEYSARTADERVALDAESQMYVRGRPTFARRVPVELGRAGETVGVAFLAASFAAGTIVGPFASHFTGISLPATEAGCLQRLDRVTGTAGLPMLVTAVLPRRGVAAPLYQRLARWESGRVHAVPSRLVARADEVRTGTIAEIGPEQAAFQAPIVRRRGGAWDIRGYGTPPADPYYFTMRDRSRSVLAGWLFEGASTAQVDTDLMLIRPAAARRSDVLVVEGILETGGLLIGLVAGSHPAGSVTVTVPGPFSALIEVAHDGEYVVGLGNWLNGYTSLEQRATIRTLGWARSPAEGS